MFLGAIVLVACLCCLNLLYGEVLKGSYCVNGLERWLLLYDGPEMGLAVIGDGLVMAVKHLLAVVWRNWEG